MSRRHEQATHCAAKKGTLRGALAPAWRRARAVALGASLCALGAVVHGAGPVGAVGPCGTGGVLTEPDTCTYSAPGEDTFTVPAAVTSLQVVAVGGRGGNSPELTGGSGARVGATVPVTPQATLSVVVGETGASGGTGSFDGATFSWSGGPGGAGGSNGGGAGGRGGDAGRFQNACTGGGGGGGASDVRALPRASAGSLASRLVVAAGGGGGGGRGGSGFTGGNGGPGGAGGAGGRGFHNGFANDPTRDATGGGAGTATGAGGGGGSGWSDGSGGGGSGDAGGSGGPGASDALAPGLGCGGAGGGAGGGWFGGGGGGGGANGGSGGGGGGGASFVAAGASGVWVGVDTSGTPGVVVRWTTDATPPTTTVALTPATPNGTNGWYTSGVRVAVGAADNANGSGVAETRCVLDPATAPAGFDAIPTGCAYSGAGADVTGQGQHTLVAASKDNRGNAETPATTAFKIDTVAPTTALGSTASSPTKVSPVPVTVNFSEPVTGFAASAIMPTNATVGNFAGSGASYTFDLVPSGQGLVGASIAAGVAQDAAGNDNTAAAPFSRTFDSVGPSVAVGSLAAPADGSLPAQSVSAFPATVGARPVTLAGTVSDPAGVASVTVNGLAAALSGGSWSAANVPLPIVGSNTLTVTATDALGNSAGTSVAVVFSLDLDGDGIRNNVDTSPNAVGNAFSDAALGGRTSGTVARNGKTVDVLDHPAASRGVRLIVSGTGGGPAQVTIKGQTTSLPNGTYTFTDPPGEVTVEVELGGPATVALTIGGAPATVVIEAGEIARITETTGGTVAVEALQGTVTVNDTPLAAGQTLKTYDLCALLRIAAAARQGTPPPAELVNDLKAAVQTGTPLGILVHRCDTATGPTVLITARISRSFTADGRYVIYTVTFTAEGTTRSVTFRVRR